MILHSTVYLFIVPKGNGTLSLFGVGQAIYLIDLKKTELRFQDQKICLPCKSKIPICK